MRQLIEFLIHVFFSDNGEIEYIFAGSKISELETSTGKIIAVSLDENKNYPTVPSKKEIEVSNVIGVHLISKNRAFYKIMI